MSPGAVSDDSDKLIPVISGVQFALQKGVSKQIGDFFYGSQLSKATDEYVKTKLIEGGTTGYAPDYQDKYAASMSALLDELKLRAGGETATKYELLAALGEIKRQDIGEKYYQEGGSTPANYAKLLQNEINIYNN